MSIQSNVLDPVSAQQLADPYGSLRNFNITKKLGHGHFSVVYSAKNRCDGRSVALKKVEVRRTMLVEIVTLSLSADRTNDRRQSDRRLQTGNHTSTGTSRVSASARLGCSS